MLAGHSLGEELGTKNIQIAKDFGLNASLFNAIPGNNCSQLYKQHKVRPPRTNKLGHHGCFMSHFLLWKKCIELNETIVILEHDGVFLRPLPDNIENNFIDICRLDPCIFWKDSYEADLALGLTKLIDYCKPDTVYRERYFGNFYIGQYGYLIKPSGADKLVKQAKKVGGFAVDMFIGTNIVDIVSVTSPVVRLDSTYTGKGISLSTTDDFDKNANG